MKRPLLDRLIAVIAFICFSSMTLFAEQTNGNVYIKYESLPDGGIMVTEVINQTDKVIELWIDRKMVRSVNPKSGESLRSHASQIVNYKSNAGGATIWKPKPKNTPVAEETQAQAPVTPPAGRDDDKATEDQQADERKPDKKDRTAEPDRRLNSGNTYSNDRAESTPGAASSIGYLDLLNQDDFFGKDAVKGYTKKVEDLCRGIESSKNKSQFIIDNDVRQFLESSQEELALNRDNLANTAEAIVKRSDINASARSTALTYIIETLNSRLKTREDAYNRLNDIVENINDSNSQGNHSSGEDILNYAILGAVVLLLIILIIVSVSRRKKKQGAAYGKNTQPTASNATTAGNPDIVVRRRTTSIMKKQCIDDVIGNPAYMMIETSDFTPDSAVGKIYIKNTCIKKIYNLYAEDLRNTEKPNEDGCMVLGRWVCDPVTHTYDISLEEVVLPGDDAVFKEYELNFGGKIKLRIAEKLRKLRMDTNLQYDLVCWIHSHPGLGIFFSNSDDSVQMQLKHSQHPNFLIAFVVDILTSDQEMGIFTFRKDGSMNSKGDITKMYSLEEMYRWALQSERSTFSHDNYFNILENAAVKFPLCKGVELNNSSIIDLTQIVIEPDEGIVGWALGTTIENRDTREYAVSAIVRNSQKPATGIIGCLISMTHMSFPTIQRLIARDCASLSFVIVYSSRQMSLTTIPVINGQPVPDEQFYGDVNIDDLKIWTRRKR